MTSETRAPTRRVLQPLARIDPDEAVQWADAHDSTIALSVAAAKAVLPTAADCSDQEVSYFLHYCAARHTNPFLQDAYLIKYDKTKPASIVTGYHYFMQAVKRDANYKGFELWYVDNEGKRIKDGLETKQTVQAAICEVHVEGRLPTKAVCRMQEFNKAQAQWNMMPVQMLGKCAVGNAHRLADPGLAGMYLPEEMAQEYVDVEAREIEDESATEAPQTESPAAEAGPSGAEAEGAAVTPPTPPPTAGEPTRQTDGGQAQASPSAAEPAFDREATAAEIKELRTQVALDKPGEWGPWLKARYRITTLRDATNKQLVDCLDALREDVGKRAGGQDALPGTD
ncbi:MAG: recombinase RecT [Proteobacteria bacterium]|nr:recombinase RecT [Pseudomonadota bacterium]